MPIDLLTVSKELLGLGSALAKAQHERRIAFANYLDKIADCVDKISQHSRNKSKEYPYAACEELEIYGRECAIILKEMLDDKHAQDISEKIEAATYARKTLFFVDSLKHASSSPIKDLDQAIGHLRGVANTLRAPVAVFENVTHASSPRDWLRRIWKLVIGKG